MPFISPSRFLATTIASGRLLRLSIVHAAFMLCARLEWIFALQFRQCPDSEQNIRNPVFVHEHEDDSRVSTEAKEKWAVNLIRCGYAF